MLKDNSAQYVLAIDQGGQSTRVAVFDYTGKIIATCKTPVHTEYLANDCVELNAESILQGIQQSLTQIAQELGPRCQYIKSAGYAGQGSTLAFWNSRTGQSLMPSLSWQDLRGKKLLANLALNHADIENMTGLKVSPHYGASKIAWVLQQNAECKAAAKNNAFMAGPLASFIFQRLSIEKAEPQADPGHGQRTLLWSRHTQDWMPELLKSFNVTPQMLPKAVLHQAQYGSLSLNNHNIPITLAMRDQGASLFSRGEPSLDIAYVNLGTGGFIQRVSEKPTPPKGQLISPLWLSETSPNLWAIEASVNGAASALGWLEKITSITVTPDTIAQALDSKPQRLFYLFNAQGGLAAPFWRTDCESHFSHDNLTTLEKITAWAESVLFLVSINITLMHESASPISTIIITGGLANNDSLCQRLANLTQLPVERPDDRDATLRGLAYKLANTPKTWQVQPINKRFIPKKDTAIHARFMAWQTDMNERLTTG